MFVMACWHADAPIVITLPPGAEGRGGVLTEQGVETQNTASTWHGGRGKQKEDSMGFGRVGRRYDIQSQSPSIIKNHY